MRVTFTSRVSLPLPHAAVEYNRTLATAPHRLTCPSCSWMPYNRRYSTQLFLMLTCAAVSAAGS